MNELERIISSMDFEYFGSGQHKINIESFFNKKNAVFLDVRAKEEVETMKLQLKHHHLVTEIPLHELPSRINELPKNIFVGVFCSSGVRSTMAFAYLKSKGYENVKIIEGGYHELMDVLLPGKLFKHLNK
ncbi:MAG: rhodanese-like domain-containing protein [Salinivirgaceae bacterium]|nr:rhodanese-like domain-containing protein [Salinivirgaceae bacterium]